MNVYKHLYTEFFKKFQKNILKKCNFLQKSIKKIRFLEILFFVEIIIINYTHNLSSLKFIIPHFKKN